MRNHFSKVLGEKLLKVSDVHEATKINKTTLTNFYYQRHTNVQLDTLIKICDYLQISLNELVEYIPEDKEV